MKNDSTIKQIRFYGLNKIFVDLLGRNSSNIINDFLSEGIKSGTIYNALTKYYLQDDINKIIIELEKNLSLPKKNLKTQVKEEIKVSKASDVQEETLEIGAKGFNI